MKQKGIIPKVIIYQKVLSEIMTSSSIEKTSKATPLILI